MATDPTTLKNSDWTRTSFLVPKGSYGTQDRQHRFLSDARLDFSDTTLGGAPCINPPPQFCRYADIKVTGLLAGRVAAIDTPMVKGDDGYVTVGQNDPHGSTGLGRYYAEALRSTGEYVTFRFGTPKFNNILSFMSNFYDTEASAVARTGKGTSIFFKLGRVVGFVVGMMAAPGLMVGKALMFLIGSKVSKYYYMTPAMHNYWSAANNILNGIAVNMKIIPTVGGKGDSEEALEARRSEIEAYMAALPDTFRKDGGIDIWAVANKYNRVAAQFQARVNKIAKGSNSQPDFIDKISSGIYGAISDTNKRNIKNYIDDYIAIKENQIIAKQEEDTANTFALADDGKSAVWNFTQKMIDFGISNANDGSEWVTFRVDHTGPSTESFSSQIGQSSIADKLNGMTAQARSLKFDAGQFQTGIGLIDSTMSAVKDMLGGGAAFIGVENIGALLGNAYVDIPKIWQNSSAQMNRMTYTIELRSWSGAPMARFQNLMVPLALLMAAALPQSTGKQSYTSPFLLEAYSRSRCQIRLGMIDSLSITRGVGNLGRNIEGDALGITVQFSVTDMSEIMHMPISTGIGFMNKVTQAFGKAVDAVIPGDGAVAQTIAAATGSNVYDDDNAFTDYLATLGGLTMQEQTYMTQKWRLNLTKQRADFDSWLSVGNAMNQFSGSIPGRILSIVARGNQGVNSQ